MGKNRNRNKRPAAAQENLGAPDVAYSGFSGANYSLNRGQVFWPSLDTRDELDQFSHHELLRRVRWLSANVGFLKGFIKNSARLVGTMKPQSAAGDAAWEEEAEKAFERATSAPGVFDRAGKFNFRKAQRMIMKQALRDGDVLTVLTESASGGRPMFAFYEAHQIRNPKENPEGWKSGVKLNNEDRHTYYGVGKGKDDAVPVPADRCIYFGSFDSCGNRRAYPPMAHAVNHSLDVTETWANVKAAIKVSSLFGAVRETESNSNSQTKSAAGMPGTLLKTMNPAAPGEFHAAQVWGVGQIPELPKGQKMKILHDARPASEQQAFVQTLLRDIAAGFGLPLEVMWSISELTGPAVRFVMDVASRWIQERQEDLEEWCTRVWVYVLAKEMKAGRLRVPPDGIDWWKVDFVPQRDITIDRGREGKQKMEEVSTGMGTHSDYHREKGSDWRDAARQRIKETAYHMALCKEMGVPYELVFAPRLGAAAPPVVDTSKVEE